MANADRSDVKTHVSARSLSVSYPCDVIVGATVDELSPPVGFALRLLKPLHALLIVVQLLLFTALGHIARKTGGSV